MRNLEKEMEFDRIVRTEFVPVKEAVKKYGTTYNVLNQATKARENGVGFIKLGSSLWLNKADLARKFKK